MVDPSPARIVIAGEHPIFRDGLRRLLETQPDFLIAGECGFGAAGLRLVREKHPNVLLLGFAGSPSRAVEMLQSLVETEAGARTIVLTDSLDTPDVIRSVQLGVRGLVLTDSAPDVLISSIRAVMADLFWIGSEAVAGVLPSLKKLETDRRRSKAFGLTRRELEILRAVVEGYTNKEIAERSSISENTVKSHLTHIFNKLGASNRVELALFAAHHRLLGGV